MMYTMTTCNRSVLVILVIGVREKFEKNKNWKEGAKLPWNIGDAIVNIENPKVSAKNWNN